MTVPDMTLCFGPHNHGPRHGYCCLRFIDEETGAQRPGILRYGHMGKNELHPQED